MERGSHTLDTLTKLMPSKVSFKWTEIKQRPFEQIKRILDHNTLLAYPYFNKRLYIHTDVSDFQLGLAITKEVIPIDFYRIKLTGNQKRYT